MVELTGSGFGSGFGFEQINNHSLVNHFILSGHKIIFKIGHATMCADV